MLKGGTRRKKREEGGRGACGLALVLKNVVTASFASCRFESLERIRPANIGSCFGTARYPFFEHKIYDTAAHCLEQPA